MHFFQFDEDIIVAAENQKDSEDLYKEEYGADYLEVVEIPEDTVVGFAQSPSSTDGYQEVILKHIVEEGDKLPFIVNVEGF